MRTGGDDSIDNDLRQRTSGPGVQHQPPETSNEFASPRRAAREYGRRRSRCVSIAYAVVVLLALFFAYHLFLSPKEVPKVVHANRYSKDFKYRPAASPVITETLKDGRTRLRGAHFTVASTPSPKPKPTKPTTKRRKGKKGKKGRA
ncbi:hypothetical protein SCHPADRAFT_994134 [Schizopora paradoxa]|uniref:Transmembrane protein n=1 Tax=Schizopora paradoxa TaxID=27342 RepID=A0A0H2S0B2_9AGAM|nr:hypothetical protein SCHPADRAFT_994134 [Schizopora paradoxa]